jgi:hypothetical protein
MILGHVLFGKAFADRRGHIEFSAELSLVPGKRTNRTSSADQQFQLSGKATYQMG